jgi:RimJ/RimL family protein N-acetyltransferase
VPDCWGKGLAPEAARAMAAFAFETLDAPTLVAVCLPENAASKRVMETLGMHNRGLETWYERPHAVVEITRAQWQGARTVKRARPPAPARRPG